MSNNQHDTISHRGNRYVANLPSHKILIVDDKPANLFALRKVLEKVDADVVDAESGDMALKAVLQHDFSLIILDVQMPVMDGYELASYLQGDPKTKNIPIIFMTANIPDEATIFKGYASGAIDYITKPYAPVVLIGKVKILLEMDRTKRDLKRHRNHLQDLVDEQMMRLSRLSTAIEQSPEAVVITDQAGIIQYVNPSFETLTGYTYEEAVGETPRILKSGHQTDEFYRNMWNTITSGEIHKARMVNRRKDGTLYTEEHIAGAVYAEDGSLQGFVAHKRDITKDLEKDARLQQAQKIESIGQLAGGVAHDFNNLLMAMTGYLDLCRDELEPEHPVQAMLDEISADAKRSANVVNQLLAFARKQPISPKIINLNSAVESVLKLLQRLIGENIAFEWKPMQAPLFVKLDASQLDQILANLCINAREAIGDAGKITIETGRADVNEDDIIHLNSDATSGSYVTLKVCDDGCGMDRQTRERVFEPFFTTRGHDKGTGLGLATVHGIVTQNNGFIDVESEVGKGTTFRMYFPEQGEERVPDNKENRRLAQSGGNETVLFVDDEKSIRKTSEIFLKKSGYHVLVEGDPVAAIKTAEEHAGAIDLLITDVIMPDMTGKTLAKRIRQFYPDLKCIYISGYTDDIIANHGTLDEGVHFLAKPFDRQELTDKVRAVLDEIN